MAAFLHWSLFLLLLAAWRFAVLWFRPMRPHNRCEGRGCPKCRQSGMVRRIGGKGVARLRLSVHLAARDLLDRPGEDL